MSIVITGCARTPMGEMLGSLSTVSAPQLGALAILSAIERSGMKADEIDYTIMGCVLSAGLGQAPARQAGILAGIPNSKGALTINKMCGSGMQAMMLAHDLISADSFETIACGGLENMSLAPYLLPKARMGMRMGHASVMDSMFYDGLEDAYEKGTLMGVFADRTAQQYQITRAQQDGFALLSLERAKKAIEMGWFKDEIVPVEVMGKKGSMIVDTDELPSKAMPEKIPLLKPAFAKEGSVTAANSSGISDGASAHILMQESLAKSKNLPIVAHIRGHVTHSQEPQWFTTAPIGAIEKLLKKVGWTKEDVDLFEINEAFAVVTLAAIDALALDINKVNIHGGACALGHPIGASGARIVTTLIHALKRKGLKRGIAALCIGGGEATAMAIELP